MSQDIPTVLASYIEETQTLTRGTALPTGVPAPAAVIELLADARQRLDRVEALLAAVIRIRARAHRAANAAKADASDAWDKAAMRRRASSVQRGDEFYSARERDAEANLASLDLIHTHRRAAELAHHCDEAHDVIRLHHRGLDSFRQDLHAVMRAMTFEHHLER